MAEAQPINQPRTVHKRLIIYSAWVSAVISALLCIAIAVCYAWRLDAWAAVTVFPFWVWPLAGIVLVVAARRQVDRRFTLAVGLAWCIVMFVFADHPLKLLRLTPSRDKRTLRLVSLNCAGDRLAVAEVAALRPDIVLIQESPGGAPLVALARELFGKDGQVLVGIDASIVARGTIEALPLSDSATMNAVFARLQLPDGPELEVVSLRLEAPIVRIDLWSPQCWREQTANRQRRRKQLEAILSAVSMTKGHRPLIIGGDFNAPPRDAIFQLLSPLHDAFAQAGRGWGNTIINPAPFLRIDQVWLSPQLQAVDVYSRRTEHSDHRMVVCDIAIASH
jgi:endonuclease/exonuclease/phosphatase (EEP) superfamily protein YafD